MRLLDCRTCDSYVDHLIGLFSVQLLENIVRSGQSRFSVMTERLTVYYLGPWDMQLSWADSPFYNPDPDPDPVLNHHTVVSSSIQCLD